MKEAERRQTQGNHRRILRCGARSFGARTLDGVPPRLSARGIIPSPRSASGQASWDAVCTGVTRLRLSQSREHLPPRSSCRGTDTQAAREQAANPPAGTALAPTTRCASAPCPSPERGLYSNYSRDACQQKSDSRAKAADSPSPQRGEGGVRGFGSFRIISTVRTPPSCPSPPSARLRASSTRYGGEGTQRAGRDLLTASLIAAIRIAVRCERSLAQFRYDRCHRTGAPSRYRWLKIAFF
jgi:hypothetical protein